MAKSPPNFLRKGRPTMIRSAPMAAASSTRAAPTSRACSRVVSSLQPVLVGHRLGQVEDGGGRLVVAGDVLGEVVRPVDLDDVDAGQAALGRADELAGRAHHEGVGRAAVEADDDASRGGWGRGHRPERYHRRRAPETPRIEASAPRADLSQRAEADCSGVGCRASARGAGATARCGRHVGLASVGHRGHDRVRSTEECALEAARDLVVEESVPPVPGDVLGQDDDGDRSRGPWSITSR